MPSQHLRCVNSRPTNVDNKTWEKWYLEEHVPSLVNHNASTRVAFHRQIFDVPAMYGYDTHKNLRNYLAIYQTDSKSEETNVFLPEKEIAENGEFDMRNYELIQEFDPEGLGDTPAPYILFAEPSLKESHLSNLDDFYREEHFPLINKVPGYRRGLRYKLGPATLQTIGVRPIFMAIHEFDHSGGIEGEEMKAVTATPWAVEKMCGATFAEIRSFELVASY